MKHYDAPVVVYPGEVCMKCLYSLNESTVNEIVALALPRTHETDH